MRSPRPTAFVIALAASSLLLTGCFTGKRAHFSNESDAPTSAVSDPAIQAVLAQLAASNTSPYTANYTVLTKYGNTTTTASVAQMDATTRSITIGHVRFLDQQSGAQTCELTTGACETGVLDERVSDTQITHDFYSSSAALRLRQDVNTMVSAAVGSTKEIADQAATCALVHFTDGDKTYCSLANGLLAEQDTPDVRIELTGLTTAADASSFTPSQ
ncbi:MAG: hypothetical protein JWN62_3704 [Acidimicrobiales bacterium]|nr:hypothetical protein [Acidimicrobiales bacterium]